MLRLSGRVIGRVAANTAHMNGAQFESEIREQPAVLAHIANAPQIMRLANAIGGRDVVFTGSGSSLFVAQLAVLAWRRNGRRAVAVAASEAHFYGAAPRDACVVALSQSGRTADVLAAVDALDAPQTIALTNDVSAPLATRANAAIDVLAGAEHAVPASKSVTAMAAILLGAAVERAQSTAAIGRALQDAATVLGAWLPGALAEADAAAALLEPAHSIIITGAGFGVPVAAEIALKIKEATYRHAEGFGAGEFRHGSTAMLDGSRAVIGIVDAWSRDVVCEVLAVARATGAITAMFGEACADVPAFGPRLDGLFAPLGWIVTGQLLALAIARRAGIDSDTPRGLRKFLG